MTIRLSRRAVTLCRFHSEHSLRSIQMTQLGLIFLAARSHWVYGCAILLPLQPMVVGPPSAVSVAGCHKRTPAPKVHSIKFHKNANILIKFYVVHFATNENWLQFRPFSLSLTLVRSIHSSFSHYCQWRDGEKIIIIDMKRLRLF